MVCFVNTYPLDSNLSDSKGYPAFEKLGTGLPKFPNTFIIPKQNAIYFLNSFLLTVLRDFFLVGSISDLS